MYLLYLGRYVPNTYCLLVGSSSMIPSRSDLLLPKKYLLVGSLIRDKTGQVIHFASKGTCIST